MKRGALPQAGHVDRVKWDEFDHLAGTMLPSPSMVALVRLLRDVALAGLVSDCLLRVFDSGPCVCVSYRSSPMWVPTRAGIEDQLGGTGRGAFLWPS